MDLNLTNDAKLLLCELYKIYKSRISNGVPKLRAKTFNGVEEIRERIFTNRSEDDIFDTCSELERAGFCSAVRSDDTISLLWLNDSSIVYMENRFGIGMEKLIDYISKLIPLIH